METPTENPPIEPPEEPTEPEEAPRKVEVGIKYALKSETSFTRDYKNKNLDGTPLLQVYSLDKFTPDKCPMGHDVNRILSIKNGRKQVECIYCGAKFESKS